MKKQQPKQKNSSFGTSIKRMRGLKREKSLEEDKKSNTSSLSSESEGAKQKALTAIASERELEESEKREFNTSLDEDGR